MIRPLLGFAAALAVTLAPIAAEAADFSFKQDNLIIQGQIISGDGDRLHEALKAAPFRTVTISSPGGLVQEGIQMANDVFANRMTVVVPENEVCAFKSGEAALA